MACKGGVVGAAWQAAAPDVAYRLHPAAARTTAMAALSAPGAARAAEAAGEGAMPVRSPRGHINAGIDWPLMHFVWPFERVGGY